MNVVTTTASWRLRCPWIGTTFFWLVWGLGGWWAGGATLVSAQEPPARFLIRYPAAHSSTPLAGRLLLLLSTNEEGEPRFQIAESFRSQQVYGIDVEAWAPDTNQALRTGMDGFPLPTLESLPAGRYRVQALLHRYETFVRGDGHTVKLPMDRGEGQQWNRAPGNLYSTPQWIDYDPAATAPQEIVLDQIISPIPEPADTPFIKHIRIQSKLLSDFWGRPMFLGAHVLLPAGFEAHPEARYPLMLFHGHFPADLSGFRPEPPDPNLAPDFSERFQLAGYNRIQQELAHQFYLDWTSESFPRVLVVELQHANPYYDDSYAVNSANLGPYGDAIVYELIPEIERRFRGIGAGWARFMYGGSTGGWEALAAQIFYPNEFNGCYAACPDPIDFRAYGVVNLYEDRNAYYRVGPFGRVARPGHRNYLGHVDATVEDLNRFELALGSQGRSGQQWDIWQAVYSPVGPAGYPQPIWDKRTGEIDPQVAAYWRDHYDLGHILERDWATLGPQLHGKIHIYCGDMDNYYLNNAVYLVEKFLSTAAPPYGGEIAYGDRAEHCWNGDPSRSNAYSRLRYHQMFVPRAVERILKTAPEGADLKSWRY